MTDIKVILLVFVIYILLVQYLVHKSLRIMEKDIKPIVNKYNPGFRNYQTINSLINNSKQEYYFSLLLLFSPNKAIKYITKEADIKDTDFTKLTKFTKKLQKVQIIYFSLLILLIITIAVII